MIRRSFIFLSGVGQTIETQLWRRGITDWDTYHEVDTDELPERIRRHRGMHSSHLEQAEDALSRGATAPFADWLPPNQAWRLLEEAGDRTLYLDIETTGLTYKQGGRTTVVGGHMPATGTTLLVKDQDLSADRVQAMLDEARLVVTFNGKRFDIPFLEREFDVDASHLPHLDLMHALKKVGIRGGLKSIERQLGLARAEEVDGLGGYEAVLLWKEWQRGHQAALEKLLTYNREDVVNMVPLAEIAYKKLKAKTFDQHHAKDARA